MEGGERMASSQKAGRCVRQFGFCGLGFGLLLVTAVAQAGDWGMHEWDLELAADSRYFPEDAAYGQDGSAAASASARIKYDQSWNDDRDLLELDTFYRRSDSADNRTHGDIQDLAWLHVEDSWELRTGVRTVFWGVAEFNHLVDIINQVDLAERPDGEAYLGQPMVNLSLVQDWGILDLYLLVGFRERIFPGEDGRFRLPLEVSEDAAEYESGEEDQHLDVALRWTRSLDAWELAASLFAGTGRDPEFNSVTPDFKLVPYYPQITQAAVEMQYTHEFWLWKLEALTRSGEEGGRYAASAFGFEYTIEGWLDTAADLGLVAEYNWDERGAEAPTYLNDDVALGTRLALNNEADTDFLLGMVYDPATSERLWLIEGHHRIGEDWKVNVESFLVSSSHPPSPLEWLTQDDTDRLAPVSRDDYIQIELVRYF